ncbi:MAG: hypothetical protein U1F41_09960 [Burkholderiales bacterium]
MKSIAATLLVLACAAPVFAQSALVTLAEGSPKVLRGATWYKLVPGIALEDADIVAIGPKQQLQVESASGSAVNMTGESTLVVGLAKDGVLTLHLPSGFAKAAVKTPAVRLRTPSFETLVADAIVVVNASANELFVEAGSAKIADGGGLPREARRGEYWVKSGGAFVTKPLAPKPFVDALPRNYIDPLPTLASRIKSKPPLAVDHEITFAEAEPWLAGKDRAVYEKRFAARLRDPEFRKAVEPHSSRYPSWDRILHPEKYLPKDESKATLKEAS